MRHSVALACLALAAVLALFIRRADPGFERGFLIACVALNLVAAAAMLADGYPYALRLMPPLGADEAAIRP